MTDFYIGEIRLFALAFAPQGWLSCEGQTLQIRDYQALFALIHNQYGGDGTTTFCLPDLRGRVPVHMQTSAALAKAGGTETVTLTVAQIPAHTHSFNASTQPAAISGVGNAWYAALDAYSATSGPTKLYAAPVGSADVVSLYPGSLSASGGGQAHANMQPYLPIGFCIAVTGLYPPRTS